MRIPSHRLPPPASAGGGSRRDAVGRPAGGRVIRRSDDTVEVRWVASLTTVGGVAALAGDKELLRHLALTVTLDGGEVVLTVRIKDPRDTAGRARMVALLAELQDRTK